MSENKNITVLNMDTNFLKLIGILTMIIDHIGVVFFPRVIIFRLIGRIAFPIFTYCMMVGYFKTSNLKKYILRLLIIGVITQPIYFLVFDVSFFRLNIMFTLICELILYYALDKKKWWIIPFCVVIPYALKLDYSIIYLFLVAIFYYSRNNKFILFLSIITFYFNYAIDTTIYNAIPTCVTAFSVLFLPFVLFNTNTHIKLNKYFFYLFYPLHLLILLIIKSII